MSNIQAVEQNNNVNFIDNNGVSLVQLVNEMNKSIITSQYGRASLILPK